MEQNKLCDYGCGKPALFRFKNGKLCCSSSTNSCLIKRKKNTVHMLKEWSNSNSYYGSDKWLKNNSEGIKKIWNNKNSVYHTEKYKQNQKEGTKKAVSTEEHKKIVSKNSKNYWNSLEYSKRKELILKIANSQRKLETRLKRSNTMKKLRKETNNYNDAGKKLSLYLKEHPINRKKDKNSNWKGGISFNPYPDLFNNNLKNKIKNRDNNQCQNPLCVNRSKRLTIHHIDYIKENLSETNLITLCNSCNVRANSNRKHWTKFYLEIILLKGLKCQD